MIVFRIVAMPASTRSQKPHARAALMPTLDAHLLVKIHVATVIAVLLV